jgi:hypothetical protein
METDHGKAEYGKDLLSAEGYLKLLFVLPLLQSPLFICSSAEL